MTSLIEGVVCARCEQAKPPEEFSRNTRKKSGLDSWCNACKSEYARDYYLEGKKASTAGPHTRQITAAVERGEALEFSRAVCNHVAWYVQRKITEFESAQNLEAPPHVMALLTIAKSISAQHPDVRLYDHVCDMCGASFTARATTRMFCDDCVIQRRRERKNTWKKTPAGKAARRLRERQRRARARTTAPPKPPLIITCQRCGAQVEAKSKNRRFCDECADASRREWVKDYVRDYNQTPQAKEAKRRYKQSEKGKAATRAYRQRQRAALP